VAIDLDTLPPSLGGTETVLSALLQLETRGLVSLQRPESGTSLANPGSSLDTFTIDWRGLERRRQAEQDKLDTVQRYAYAKGCRRTFVLRYFGDPAANGSSRCDGCDNCTGTRRDATPAATVTVRRQRRPPSDSKVASKVLPHDEPLFTALKTLRTEIASAARVPPYVVFPDTTLIEFAVQRPRSLPALADIRGVGPAKLDKYGERFLAVIRQTEAVTNG
jgi:ATP-dependent DNA helicase RecQ